MAKLFYCETLNPRKACAAARFLNADVEFVRVDLGRGEQRTAEFLAINPNGKVPALQDGERTLWEANAIMCHLSDSVGADFWPHDERQTDIIRWLSWDAGHFTHHGATLWFENEVKPLLGGAPNEKIVDDAEASLKQFARVLDDHLADRRYVVGGSVSVADFALAAALPYAATSRLPLDAFINIQRWHNRLNELEAWRDPFPSSNR